MAGIAACVQTQTVMTDEQRNALDDVKRVARRAPPTGPFARRFYVQHVARY
jgi:hypothetical protein